MYQELFLNSVVWYPPSQASKSKDSEIDEVSILSSINESDDEDTNPFVDSVEENKKVDKSEKGVELVILVFIKLSSDAKETVKFDDIILDVESEVFSEITLSKKVLLVVISIHSSALSLSFVEVVIEVEMFCNISFSVFVQDLISKNFGML